MPPTPVAMEPLLTLVAFAFGVSALGWLTFGALLREDRQAIMHWSAFLFLVGLGLWLSTLRGEPREWLPYNGTNLVTVTGFALLRRGTEHFMRTPSSDREQLLLMGGLCLVIALIGPGQDRAALRIVLAYAAQGYTMLRLLWSIRQALRQEFGQPAQLSIIVPGCFIAAVLLLQALRQLLQGGSPLEMQRQGAPNHALMFAYLFGAATFSFGFMALVTQRLVRRLRQASQRDALTGLLNRGAIEEALAHEGQRVRRLQGSFALLLVDADHFKLINDRFGHAAGDRALQHLAAVMSAQVRDIDRVGRWGGEEFVVLLPATALADACRLAERINERVAALPARWNDQPLPLTVSIGVAQWRNGEDDEQSLVQRADAALYTAKVEGRNAVRCG